MTKQPNRVPIRSTAREIAPKKLTKVKVDGRRSMMNSSYRTHSLLGTTIAALLIMPNLASAQEASAKDEVFAPTAQSPVFLPAGSSPLASFDISWVDSVLRNYYLADRSNKAVDVINTDTKVPTQFKPTSSNLPPVPAGAPTTFVGSRNLDAQGHLCSPPSTIPPLCTPSNDVSGPDGVLTTTDHKQLWVGDGDSRVWVLDAKTGTPVSAPAGATNPISTVSKDPARPSNPLNRADELCFDPVEHLVMVANNADSPPFASIISTDTFQVVKQIFFDGSDGAPNSNNGAEQCQWSSRTGKFFISIPGIAGHPDGEGGVAVIDPTTKTVVDTFIIPVDLCAAPQGMAVGPDNQILLGCNGTSPNGHANTVIINERSGAVVGRLPDLGGDDEVWFNPGDGHYSLAGGQNIPEQLGIADSAGHRADKTFITAQNPNATGRRAHSVAADSIKNEVYLPIPAVNATAAPGYDSDLCGTTTTAKAQGCVAIFSASKNVVQK
jgi:hypothetical protein